MARGLPTSPRFPGSLWALSSPCWWMRRAPARERCVGTRRSPGALDEGSLAGAPDSLSSLQSSLLAAASSRVAVGGCLVYATCSVLSCENSEVVDAFLASDAGSGFELASVMDAPASRRCRARHALRSRPGSTSAACSGQCPRRAVPTATSAHASSAPGDTWGWGRAFTIHMRGRGRDAIERLAPALVHRRLARWLVAAARAVVAAAARAAARSLGGGAAAALVCVVEA